MKKRSVILAAFYLILNLNLISALTYDDCDAVPVDELDGRTCANVNSCSVAMEFDKYYLLTGDITSSGNCFNFNPYYVGNAVFNLNGKSITYGTGGSGHAFNFGGSTGPEMWVQNIEIKNGAIITGSTSMAWTAAINMWRSENVRVHDITFTILGPDNSGINGCPNCRGVNEFYNNNFLMDTTTQDACSHFAIAGAFNFHQHSGVLNVYNNNFSGKGMKGISISDCYDDPAAVMSIYGNRIEMWSWKRDGYAIAVEGLHGACSGGTEIYDNFINQSSGRGVVIAGWNVPDDHGPQNFDIYNNYIEVQEGASCEGGHNGNTYGLRVRFGAGNIAFHDNTILAHAGAGLTADTTNGVNDGSDGFGIKAGASPPYGQNVNIYNNNITVDSNAVTNRLGGWIQARAIDSGIAGVSSPVIFESNTISSNEILVNLGEPDYGSNQKFISNTFIRTDDLYGTDFKTLRINNQWDVVGINLLNTTIQGGADVHDITFTGDDAGSKGINITWYLTVQVDSAGAPAEGANVLVESMGAGSITASQVLDDTGSALFMLPELTYTSRTPTYYGPYTVTATFEGESQSTQVVLDRSEELSFTFGAVRCTDGDTRECGTTDIGACEYGNETCANEAWGECIGYIDPVLENCTNSIDDDCDGLADYEDDLECIPPSCTLPLDEPTCDCLDNEELTNSIAGWYDGELSISQLMLNIATWKVCSDE